MMVILPLGPEISIATANNVGGNRYVRVINTGNAAVLHFTSNTGTEYANLTVSNTQYIVVEKGWTDTLTGTSMLAVPVAKF